MNIFKITNKKGPARQLGGFTLIELLVVVSIISLLSSIILSSINDARAKARDARRLSDIQQLRNALEMYRNDYGRYPIISESKSDGNYVYSSETGWKDKTNTLASALTPKYITSLPVDPLNNGLIYDASYKPTGKYSYYYATNYNDTVLYSPVGEEYDLVFRLEKPNAQTCPVKTVKSNLYNDSWCNYGGAGTRLDHDR